MRLATALAAALAVATGCTPATPAPGQDAQAAVPSSGAGLAVRHGPRDPMPPVSGRPLEPGSGLRLLVTGEGGAFRLDVDSGVRTRIRGLPYGERAWAFTAGSRELVLTTPSDAGGDGRLFLLYGDRAHPLGTAGRFEGDGGGGRSGDGGGNDGTSRRGTGSDRRGDGGGGDDRGGDGTSGSGALFAFAAADGKGVWALQRVRGDDCRLRPLDFRGRERGRALRTACSRAPSQDTPQGLLSFAEQGRARLLDRATGEEVFAEQNVHTVTRDLVLVSKGSLLTLVEPEAARRTPLPAPDTEGAPSRAEVSPDGRRIALWFADPAWPGPRQYLDVQVLDLGTRTWTRLPSMPVPASIKSTSMAWTGDGRLVLAGNFVTTSAVMPAESDYAPFVIAWRPGESRLSLRRLDLPPHHQSVLTP
ncbi:hypothetical protein ACFXJ8_03645 [Nonomuraea sp. NPDC059194]|uniref:hypothetical protein n=1 Tax=Nonomuraea sp. NPDC059194 TaxID=3346764 RepID=UPI0036974616